MPLPEKTSLVLGRGEVYFDRFKNGVPEGERYLGNTPSFQMTRTVEHLARKQSYRGAVHEVPGALISESISLSITTDNIDWSNVSEWFSSDAPNESTVLGDEFLPYTEQVRVKHGRWYTLGKQFSPVGPGYVERVTGIRNGATSALRDGIDWTVDNRNGRFFIIPGSPRALQDSLINVTYYKWTSGQSIVTSTPKEVLGAIRYLSFNKYGPKTDYYFPLVRIMPQGAIELKGDEWQQMRFSANAMKLSAAEPLVYAIRSGFAPKPITADSTLITADTTLYTADIGAWQE